MKLRITIDLGNSAFEDNRLGEIGRILSDLIGRLPNDGETTAHVNLHDVNGNRVGTATIE